MTTHYHLPWLLDKVSKQDKLKYLLFWGHSPAKNGQISKTCFSQWYASPFIVDDIRYMTAEHWMMAEKARLFNDISILEKILNTHSPAEVKKLGRQISHFSESVWQQQRYELICRGNYHKFNQHPELKEFLLNTQSRILVEASPYDRIWGIGLDEHHPHSTNPHYWKGLNLLGFALMEVRDQLHNLQ